MLKFFRIPFATSGDKTAIPDAADPGGNVSYTQGYGFDYQRAKTDPLSKNIERDKMNDLFFDMTNELRILQSQGVPDFIDPTLNDGAPYSYSQNALVRYTDGAVYMSLVNANTADPTDPTKWAPLSALKTTGAQIFTAGGNFTVPAGVSRLFVEVWGGGGGGGGITGAGGAGGTSSFGAFLSATGGAGGPTAASTVGGAGGSGTGGDVNLSGSQGGASGSATFPTVGGYGGSSPFGGAGGAGGSTGVTEGRAGVTPGGGGGGIGTNGTASGFGRGGGGGGGYAAEVLTVTPGDIIAVTIGAAGTAGAGAAPGGAGAPGLVRVRW